MSDTTYVSGTVVTSGSLNDFNTTTYKAQSGIAGSTNRTAISKFSDEVSVLDFGADPTGVANSTTAFNNAIASGKAVFVPAGTYSVSDVNFTNGLRLYGEGSTKTILQVRTNSTAAFRNTVASSSLISDVEISNLRIEAATGVTLAKGYRQDNHDGYAAYVRFVNIETSKSLLMGYDGFFIFTVWSNCRDGYVGSYPVGQDHQFIVCNPVSTGQTFQCNMNSVQDCKVFGATSTAACAIDIQYGSNWSFRNTDFETLSTLAVRSRGVFNGSFDSCWFESITSANVIQLIECPGPNAQGSGNWVFRNCMGVLNVNNTTWITSTLTTTVSAYNCSFLTVPTNTVFIDLATQLRTLESNNVISGDSNFINSLSDGTLNQNIFPLGPTGIGAANLTNNGFTAKADVASAIGLADNAVRFTLSNVGSCAYYTFPSKLLDFVKGRGLTIVITGYGDSAGSEILQTCAWDSVAVPSFSNATSISSNSITVSNPALQTTSVYVAVGSGATSFRVGVRAGGNANTKLVTVESMRVFIGGVNAISAGLK